MPFLEKSNLRCNRAQAHRLWKCKQLIGNISCFCTVMEIIDNALMLVIPGAMEAGLASPLFWGSMILSLLLAGMAAFPLNRWLIGRGRGHAVVHHIMRRKQRVKKSFRPDSKPHTMRTTDASCKLCHFKSSGFGKK